MFSFGAPVSSNSGLGFSLFVIHSGLGQGMISTWGKVGSLDKYLSLW